MIWKVFCNLKDWMVRISRCTRENSLLCNTWVSVLFCVLTNGVINLGILEYTLPFTSIACGVTLQRKTNRILLGTTKLQTALYAQEGWTVYQLNNQGLRFCGDVCSTPGQYFHGGLWMFGVVLLTFAGSARQGGATNTWLRGISITVFIYWACEHETAINKLQFNFKLAIIKSYLQDGRTTWLADVL